MNNYEQYSKYFYEAWQYGFHLLFLFPPSVSKTWWLLLPDYNDYDEASVGTWPCWLLPPPPMIRLHPWYCWGWWGGWTLDHWDWNQQRWWRRQQLLWRSNLPSPSSHCHRHHCHPPATLSTNFLPSTSCSSNVKEVATNISYRFLHMCRVWIFFSCIFVWVWSIIISHNFQVRNNYASHSSEPIWMVQLHYV
jgi:hypothetical protein